MRKAPLTSVAFGIGLGLFVSSFASAQSTGPRYRTSTNEYNPAISVTLQGLFTNYSTDQDDLTIPGFQLGPEMEKPAKGFSLGESEITISADVDDYFYGSFTLGFHSDSTNLETEIEEAYLETLGLGHGFTLRGGRWFSQIGYQNKLHQHAWDFFDAPLVYDAIWGKQYVDDSVQLRWVAPTDIFVQLGGEVLSGHSFPASGGANNGVGAWDIKLDVGSDIGASHSWQAGAMYWRSEVENRVGGGHAHEDGGEAVQASYTGTSQISGVDLVYKWAPNGNPTQRNFQLQFEWFKRDEDGDINIAEPPPEASTYDGEQWGWYLQGVYQLIPKWRVGLRYSEVDADNTGSKPEVLAEAGLIGQKSTNFSAMVDWSHSEFSRVRAQYNRPKLGDEDDNVFILQYILSLGAHGAHSY